MAKSMNNCEDPFGGHEQLVHEPHRFEPRDEQSVDHEHDRRQRQRPADHASRRLEHDHGQDDARDHVGRGQVVDVEDAGDDVLVIDEQMQDRHHAEHQQNEVERRRFVADLAGSPVKKKQQHQREHQVRAAVPDRLGRAEGDRPHVIKRHRDRDDGHRLAHDAGVAEIEFHDAENRRLSNGEGARRRECCPAGAVDQFDFTVMPTSL
jgi:hypothetical protein